MSRKSEKRDKVTRSVDGKRTDRVKQSDMKKMLKLSEKGKNNAQIAEQFNRSERTVKKSLERARAVYQQSDSVFDPITIEAKRKHIADMAMIAEALLINGLDNVRKTTIINSEGAEIIVYSTVINDNMETFSHEQLGDRLRLNFGFKWVRMNAEDTKRFMTHLKADYPALESKDITIIITENPYELIEVLRVFIRKGTIEGKCDICQQLG